jgi:hypothetical protein
VLCVGRALWLQRSSSRSRLGSCASAARNQLGQGHVRGACPHPCDQEQMATRSRNRPTPRTRDVRPDAMPPPTGQDGPWNYELPKVDNISTNG